MIARLLPPFMLLFASGCEDQPITDNYGSTTPRLERVEQYNSTIGDTDTPVRIGELGRNFAACNAQGQVNERATEGPVAVRAGPFEQAREIGGLAPGARFFICTRSLDQRWMGVVYAQGGAADRACGVSAPVPARRDYEGPCEAGWVPSAQVRLISGVEAPAAEPSQNIAQPK